jgi:hypothetical protein
MRTWWHQDAYLQLAVAAVAAPAVQLCLAERAAAIQSKTVSWQHSASAAYVAAAVAAIINAACNCPWLSGSSNSSSSCGHICPLLISGSC